MKVSIVIPAYESRGKGPEFINDLLNSVAEQTYKNIEVVVADHSTSDIIKNELEKFKGKVDINHFFNDKGRGNSSINMNEGIKRVTGDVIKIMHIDDRFCNKEAVKMMVTGLTENEDKEWGAFGFNHVYEYYGGPEHPKDKPCRIIIPSSESGQYGCPSISFFRFKKDNPIFFDENLVVINDMDLHTRLKREYGHALIVPEVSVTIRMHRDQYTNFSNEKERGEWTYFGEKMKKLNIEWKR